MSDHPLVKMVEAQIEVERIRSRNDRLSAVFFIVWCLIIAALAVYVAVRLGG